MQIPFGVWSDRIGRKPLIVVGLVLHVAGSALGAVAGSALGARRRARRAGPRRGSGPVMALLADLTRPESRTRAMFAIGMSIGAVLRDLAGRRAAAGGGDRCVGRFRPDRRARRASRSRSCCSRCPPSGRERRAWRARDWRQALTRSAAAALRRHLHAAPDADGGLHRRAACASRPARHRGLAPLARLSRRLCGSVALTVPLVLWSERNRNPGGAALIGGSGLASPWRPSSGPGRFRRLCWLRSCSISAPSISSKRACRPR